jgi:hypothetical protein
MKQRVGPSYDRVSVNNQPICSLMHRFTALSNRLIVIASNRGGIVDLRVAETTRADKKEVMMLVDD